MTPTGRQQQAFSSLHWVGCTLQAALQHPKRRQIIEFIAARHLKAMETITPISRIEQLAHQAAGLYTSACAANPYPPMSAAAALFAQCFDAEQARRQERLQRTHATLKTTATQWSQPAMHHPQIIGLTGPAGCGKDTVADLLVAYAGFAKLAFADPLRAEVATAFDLDAEHLQRRETKEHPLSALALRRCRNDGFIDRIITVRSLHGQTIDLDAPQSPRQIMQWWGTEYRRHQHQNYWVRKTEDRVRALLSERWGVQNVVITDVRFADEAELVRSLGGVIWRIERPGVGLAPGAHVSETTGAEFLPSRVIDNGGSFAQLRERVLGALAVGGLGQGVAA